MDSTLLLKLEKSFERSFDLEARRIAGELDRAAEEMYSKMIPLAARRKGTELRVISVQVDEYPNETMNNLTLSKFLTRNSVDI